jgi:sugar/nucleoside kinase (ribokinase family)
MPAIAAIGIGLVDIYPQKGRMYPGGNEYNISYYVKELGCRASFMGVFAGDKAGEMLFNLLDKAGVDLSHSRHETGYSNYAIVELRNGNRVFSDWSRTGVTDRHPIRFNQDDIAFIKQHDAACISCASRLEYSDFKMLYDAGVPLSYDFSDAFTEQQMRQICPLVQFSFFSCDRFTGEEAREILAKAAAYGSKITVATMGKNGAVCFDGTSYYSCPAPEARVTDTMGAGDSFIAAFLCSYYSDADAPPSLDRAMRQASGFAGRNIEREGALGIGYDVDVSRLNNVIELFKNLSF